jgi:hypothetical protein
VILDVASGDEEPAVGQKRVSATEQHGGAEGRRERSARWIPDLGITEFAPRKHVAGRQEMQVHGDQGPREWCGPLTFARLWFRETGRRRTGSAGVGSRSGFIAAYGKLERSGLDGGEARGADGGCGGPTGQ